MHERERVALCVRFHPMVKESHALLALEDVMSLSESVRIETREESQIDPSLDQALRRYLCAIFPNWEQVFRERRAWHDASPVFTVLAFDATGEIVGHVAAVERTISTQWNWRYRVASIQGVSVVPRLRKTGLSIRLLDQALDESRRRGYLYAILFCREPLVEFYKRNGWRLPDDDMIMWRDRKLPIHMQSNCPMYRELTSQPFPEGAIDVHNPFDPQVETQGDSKARLES